MMTRMPGPAPAQPLMITALSILSLVFTGRSQLRQSAWGSSWPGRAYHDAAPGPPASRRRAAPKPPSAGHGLPVGRRESRRFNEPRAGALIADRRLASLTLRRPDHQFN